MCVCVCVCVCGGWGSQFLVVAELFTTVNTLIICRKFLVKLVIQHSQHQARALFTVTEVGINLVLHETASSLSVMLMQPAAMCERSPELEQ